MRSNGGVMSVRLAQEQPVSMKALSAVVEVRSYSRYSRTISCDSVTNRSRMGRAENLSDAPLVRRIRIGMQKANRDRFDFLRCDGFR